MTRVLSSHSLRFGPSECTLSHNSILLIMIAIVLSTKCCFILSAAPLFIDNLSKSAVPCRYSAQRTAPKACKSANICSSALRNWASYCMPTSSALRSAMRSNLSCAIPFITFICCFDIPISGWTCFNTLKMYRLNDSFLFLL